MNEQLQSAMRRAQKLLAIAGDARANPNEAAAAASQAEKLMRKFSLEHADVMRAEFKKADNFETADAACVMKKGQGHRPRKVPAWAQWLAVATARLYDAEVRATATPELGACVRFFGFSADVKMAAFTFDYLTTEVIRGVRAFQAAETRSKADSESYRRGFVFTVLDALRRAHEEKVAEVAAQNTSRALMVVKAEAIAERFGSFRYGKSKATHKPASAAFVQGSRDGSAVDVRRRALDGSAAPAQQQIA